MALLVIFGILLASFVASSDIGNQYDVPIIGGFIAILVIVIVFRVISGL